MCKDSFKKNEMYYGSKLLRSCAKETQSITFLLWRWHSKLRNSLKIFLLKHYPSGVGQHVKLTCKVPASERVLFCVRHLQFQPSLLLMCLGKQRVTQQVVGLLHLHGGPPRSCWTLTSVKSSCNSWGHLGSKSDNARYLSFSLSLPLSLPHYKNAFQIDK